MDIPALKDFGNWVERTGGGAGNPIADDRIARIARQIANQQAITNEDRSRVLRDVASAKHDANESAGGYNAAAMAAAAKANLSAEQDGVNLDIIKGSRGNMVNAGQILQGLKERRIQAESDVMTPDKLRAGAQAEHESAILKPETARANLEGTKVRNAISGEALEKARLDNEDRLIADVAGAAGRGINATILDAAAGNPELNDPANLMNWLATDGLNQIRDQIVAEFSARGLDPNSPEVGFLINDAVDVALKPYENLMEGAAAYEEAFGRDVEATQAIQAGDFVRAGEVVSKPPEKSQSGLTPEKLEGWKKYGDIAEKRLLADAKKAATGGKTTEQIAQESYARGFYTRQGNIDALNAEENEGKRVSSARTPDEAGRVAAATTGARELAKSVSPDKFPGVYKTEVANLQKRGNAAYEKARQSDFLSELHKSAGTAQFRKVISAVHVHNMISVGRIVKRNIFPKGIRQNAGRLAGAPRFLPC